MTATSLTKQQLWQALRLAWMAGWASHKADADKIDAELKAIIKHVTTTATKEG